MVFWVLFQLSPQGKGQRQENRLRAKPRPNSEVLACLLLTWAEIMRDTGRVRGQGGRPGLLSSG